MRALRENITDTVAAQTSAHPSILCRIRDWPDPASPYSPVLTVALGALFVLTTFVFG